MKVLLGIPENKKLKLFLIKGTFEKEFQAGFVYKGVSYMRESTVFEVGKFYRRHRIHVPARVIGFYNIFCPV